MVKLKRVGKSRSSGAARGSSRSKYSVPCSTISTFTYGRNACVTMAEFGGVENVVIYVKTWREILVGE